MLVLTLQLTGNCLLMGAVYAKLADWRAFSSLWLPYCSGSTRIMGHNVSGIHTEVLTLDSHSEPFSAVEPDRA